MVMLGRQGAGKGTQCVRLARHYVVPHISTGDMLRAAVKEGTEFGLKAKSVMDAGGLVSDDIMVGVVDERLHQDDTTRRGYVLDGFPRTVPQADALAQIATDLPLDLVVNLEVAPEIVIERIAGRRVCVDCGTIYSVDVPPKYPWHCDKCGGDVVQRDDDTEDAIRRRLAIYEGRDRPARALVRAEHGLLVQIDGLGSADQIAASLIVAIDERLTHR